MRGELAAAYRSGSQRARVVTESWGEDNLYCPNCSSTKLDRLRNNTKASDYTCPACGFCYQIKGQKSRIGNQISDGAYEAMMDAIRKSETPNFYFMHYDLETWSVKNLLLIPSFAFPESAIIKRRPLALTARRAGWVGCNILLAQIPLEARISVVTGSKAMPENVVREQFNRIKPLGEIKSKERGWTLDVLNAIRTLGKIEFTNEDAYTLVPHLEKLHPGNHHVREKIRQRLQALRDTGLLNHLERGRWRIP